MIEIPVTNAPSQTFKTVINGESFDFSVNYISRFTTWAMSIGQNGVDIISGIPLRVGANLIDQYPSLNIDNLYVVNIENPFVDASVDNLGTTVKVVVLTEAEVADVTAI